MPYLGSLMSCVLIDAEQPCMQYLHIGVKVLGAKPRDYPNIIFLYIDSLFLYIDELNLLALARHGKANIHQTFLSNSLPQSQPF